MSYTVCPFPYHAFYDNNGDPLSGGLLYCYAAGTSTPQDTYSSADSVTPVANANPIVLDTNGRAKIFLAALSYKFELKTSLGVLVWTLDNVQATSIAAANATDISLCNGRITLTSATPVTTADVTAATTVYFTPYGGNRIALYDGTTWNVRTFAELSLALGTDTINKNYDLFAYDNSGVVTLERLVWTNDTTRATALVLQDGVLVKSGATTRRYLGTYRTTAAGQTEDSLAKRMVWNYYHRVPTPVRRLETTASWAYSTDTYQQANAAAANQVAIVVGVAEDALALEVVSTSVRATAGKLTPVSIGADSATTQATGTVNGSSASLAGFYTGVRASLTVYPAVGYHFYAWLERAEAGETTTWYGVNVPNAASGLHGTWRR